MFPASQRKVGACLSKETLQNAFAAQHAHASRKLHISPGGRISEGEDIIGDRTKAKGNLAGWQGNLVLIGSWRAHIGVWQRLQAAGFGLIREKGWASRYVAVLPRPRPAVGVQQKPVATWEALIPVVGGLTSRSLGQLVHEFVGRMPTVTMHMTMCNARLSLKVLSQVDDQLCKGTVVSGGQAGRAKGSAPRAKGIICEVEDRGIA